MAAAMPPSMTGRAGWLPAQPDRWQLDESEPRVGGRSLFQPGHPRIHQVLLFTPEGDDDHSPLAG
jgi:hypothetical protein